MTEEIKPLKFPKRPPPSLTVRWETDIEGLRQMRTVADRKQAVEYMARQVFNKWMERFETDAKTEPAIVALIDWCIDNPGAVRLRMAMSFGGAIVAPILSIAEDRR